MKLKFDSFQLFQLDAIASIVDLFDGQPLNKGDFTIELQVKQNAIFQTESGFANRLKYQFFISSSPRWNIPSEFCCPDARYGISRVRTRSFC